jgi:hypothetical protein
MKSVSLPTLFPSYDEKASQPISSVDVPSVDLIDHDGGSTGGTNYWVNDDPRPTKEEALEKLEEFELFADIADFLIPEEISNNIPFWIRGPWGIAPEFAEFLIEVDPLDRIQD